MERLGLDHPVSSSSLSSSSGGSGSSMNSGSARGVMFTPVREKAPDSLRNWVRAIIPFGVPRMAWIDMLGDALRRMCR